MGNNNPFAIMIAGLGGSFGMLGGYLIAKYFGWVGVAFLALVLIVILILFPGRLKFQEWQENRVVRRREQIEVNRIKFEGFEGWRADHEANLGYTIPDWVARTRYEQEKSVNHRTGNS